MSRIDTVGLARQTAGQGTKVTAMEYYPPVESSEPDQTRDEMSIEETIGSRFPTGIDYGTRYFTVPMRGAPHMASFPRILSGFLGQPTTVIVGAGPQRDHSFDVAIAGKTPEWHSIFVVRADPSPAIVDLFWDARGGELSLSCSPNDYLRMDASWIALDLDDTQSAPTATRDATARRKFSETHVFLSLDGGTTESEVKVGGWSATYSNSLDTDEAVLGSRKLYALPVGNANSEVTFSPRETLATYYRRAMLADPAQVRIRMTATATTGGDEIEWLVYSCEEVSAPAAVSGGDVLKSVEVTARARIEDATGKFVKARVRNSVASYL